MSSTSDSTQYTLSGIDQNAASHSSTISDNNAMNTSINVTISQINDALAVVSRSTTYDVSDQPGFDEVSPSNLGLANSQHSNTREKAAAIYLTNANKQIIARIFNNYWKIILWGISLVSK
ncbi:unnamed protein product [Didymodactylos carnosus]|uniref:Uncharacterized protein n=1 Tax=Didymodactylos carnosus TaxID=1234261 RepID=A0A813S1H9_9BILA|nr:unnamed protein product [Didymodactylos carnosus]CAF1189498.1 unnamed protein product [Didymodactylos carnosus]CAF3572263.1 unnamed protein product [Didymodactylos carnosus]CAF4000492.1 unnamed protein product [Didymodactylos carnosus]